MNDQLLIGLIGAGSAILGSIVGAFASYKASKLGYDRNNLLNELQETYRNLLLFRKIVLSISDELAVKEGDLGKANAIYLSHRKRVQADTGEVITEKAEEGKVKSRLVQLSNKD